jgi:hypothetical protein
MNVDGMHILWTVGGAVVVGVVFITTEINQNLKAADERQLACERIGGVLVRQDRGGAVCVQRAAPPSAKGSRWT